MQLVFFYWLYYLSYIYVIDKTDEKAQLAQEFCNSSLEFLPFFGLVGVLADDTGCAETGDTCILEVRSLNVVLLPDFPPQQHSTNAGKEASQQSIENA